MKPRDLFGVGVRLFGVWFAVDSLTNLYAFFTRRFENADSKLTLSNYVTYGTYDYGLYAIMYGVLAWYCLFCTEHLVRWSYGEERRRLEEDIAAQTITRLGQSPENPTAEETKD